MQGTTWKVRTLSLGQADLAANTGGGAKLYFASMVNCEKALNVVFWVSSNLDVPITVQVFGSNGDNPKQAFSHYRFGNCFNLPPGNEHSAELSVPVGLLHGNFWHPFIGVECTTMQRAVVNGRVSLMASIREQVDVTLEGQLPQNYSADIPAPSVYPPVQGDRGAGLRTGVPVPAVRPVVRARYSPLFGGNGL